MPHDQEILNTLETLLDKEEYGGPLHEVRTREFESFFNHLFSVIPESDGFTSLWFDEDTSANAAINRNPAEVILHCDASENEHAQLETTERTNYPPGTTAAAGWATTIEKLPTGEQDAWAGVTDGNDGVGAGFAFRRSTGIKIPLMDQGMKTTPPGKTSTTFLMGRLFALTHSSITDMVSTRLVSSRNLGQTPSS